MNNRRLVDRVGNKLNHCVEQDEILETLNEGMQQVSARILFPELITKRSVSISAGTTYRVLPLDFQRELFECRTVADNKTVKILNSKTQLLAEFNGMSGQPGQLQGVAVEGGRLHLYPEVPSDISIELHYYRLPDEIKYDENSVIIPWAFRKVLFHYAMYSIYDDDIEDGMEGEKVNTLRHESKYEQYLGMLRAFYREGVSHKPVPIVKGEFL